MEFLPLFLGEIVQTKKLRKNSCEGAHICQSIQFEDVKWQLEILGPVKYFEFLLQKNWQVKLKYALLS
jgi:hypothetical protein